MIYVVERRTPIDGTWEAFGRYEAGPASAPENLEAARAMASGMESNGYEARIVALFAELRTSRGEAVVVYRTPYALDAAEALRIWKESEL